MLDKYRVHSKFTLDFFDHYGSLFSLYNVMFFFYTEKKMFYCFEALNYNYVFNSLYGNYFINFDVNLKFSLQILILSFLNYTPSNTYMSLRDLKYFKFLFKNGYNNFSKLNYLSLNKPFFNHDYFPLSLEDAITHDLYNIKSELSDINLEISYDSNIFYRIKETHPFDVDFTISSFTAYWSDLYSINTFGFIGKTQFSKLNFVVVNTYLMNHSFYVHFYEDSSYFSIQLLYMFFYFKEKKKNYISFLGNVHFNMINIFNYNIILPLFNFINSFYSFSFYNLFFYKFIFLFINVLKSFSSLLYIDLNYFYLFLQVNLFNFLSSLDLLKINKFIFYFSLFFFKSLKFNNNFLLNLNLIKSFFYLTKSSQKNKFNKKFFSKTFLNLWKSSLLQKFKKFFFFFRFKKVLKVSLTNSYYVKNNYFKKTKIKKIQIYKYLNNFLNLKFLVKKPRINIFNANFKKFNTLFLSKMKYLNFISFYLILKSVINFNFLYNNDIQLEFFFIVSRYFYLFYFFSLDLLNCYLIKFNKFKNLLKRFTIINYSKSLFYFNYYFFKIKLLFYFSFYSLHFSFLRFEKYCYSISNNNIIFNAYFNFSNLFLKFRKKSLLFLNLNKNKLILKDKRNFFKMKDFSIIFNNINKKVLKIIFNIMRLIRFNASRIILLNRFLFEIDFLSFSFFGDTRFSFLFFGYNIYMNYLNKKFKFISNFKIKFKLFKFNSDEFLYIYRNRFFRSDLKLYNKKLLYNFKFSYYGFFMRKFNNWLLLYLKFFKYFTFKKKNFFFLSINFVKSFSKKIYKYEKKFLIVKFLFNKYSILINPITFLSLKSKLNFIDWQKKKKKLILRIRKFYLAINNTKEKNILKKNLNFFKDNYFKYKNKLTYRNILILKFKHKFYLKDEHKNDEYYFNKYKEKYLKSKNLFYNKFIKNVVKKKYIKKNILKYNQNFGKKNILKYNQNSKKNYKYFLFWFKYKLLKKYYQNSLLNFYMLNYLFNKFTLKKKIYFFDNVFKINKFSSKIIFNNPFYNKLISNYIFLGIYNFLPFLLSKKLNFSFFLYNYNFKFLSFKDYNYLLYLLKHNKKYNKNNFLK